jgi:hypothetical protein
MATPTLKIQRQCLHCNKTLLSYPSRPRKFCSLVCRDLFWVGPRNPNFKGGPVSTRCRVCRRLFSQPRNGLEMRVTCSDACLHALRTGWAITTRAHRRATKNARRAISSFIHSNCQGSRKWRAIFGFGPEDLRKHLLPRLPAGATWETHGETWVVDHVQPTSFFRYESEFDTSFKKCWTLSNLQPLTPSQNLIKGPHLP